MPKYYVSSGDFQQIIDRPDPETAVYDAFKLLGDTSPARLGLITLVSEHGFDSCEDEDTYYGTIGVLEDTGQLENFKLEDWL